MDGDILWLYKVRKKKCILVIPFQNMVLRGIARIIIIQEKLVMEKTRSALVGLLKNIKQIFFAFILNCSTKMTNVNWLLRDLVIGEIF